MRALYVGRFQPFHKGHLHNIKKILEKNDEIVIAIGSAQYSHTLQNPFTCGERIEMIRKALNDLSRVVIVPVTDLHIHDVWVSHLCSLAPKFDYIYSNEPLTVRLFEEAGFEVRSLPPYRRETYNATEIRKKIIDGRSWEEYVPKEVGEFIKKIGGDERLRELVKSDR
ncbi:MAG: nicotinamide-nucleotide adenylyltransferase [Euryarchaeota archaeon]|nr:nicotinamide-nucleotide adenylyltransferase [Euryarchaeota archaeon]